MCGLPVTLVTTQKSTVDTSILVKTVGEQAWKQAGVVKSGMSEFSKYSDDPILLKYHHFPLVSMVPCWAYFVRSMSSSRSGVYTIKVFDDISVF